MSQHPSLKISKAGKKHRTVLKRFERLTLLRGKGLLKENDSVFGMPKVKIIKIKVKKEKAEEKPKEGEAVTATDTIAKAPKKESPQKPVK